MHAGLNGIAGKSIYRREALVADHDLLVLIVHAQALGHIAEGIVQHDIAGAQLLLPPAQLLVGLGEPAHRFLPFAQVADGVDLIAVAQPLQRTANDLDGDRRAVRPQKRHLERTAGGWPAGGCQQIAEYPFAQKCWGFAAA